MNTYCEICNETPCCDTCSAECEAPVHFRRATRVVGGKSLCSECAIAIEQMIGEDRYNAMLMSHACGYRD